MTAKIVVNYTPEMTASIISDYQAGAPIESIALAVGRTTRSIIAKLSREGVYTAKIRTTKTGAPVVKKDNLADQIGMLANLTEAETDSLAKANKTALAKVLSIVKAAKLLDANDVS